MVIIKQFNSEGFEKYYVFKDILNAVNFIAKRCNMDKNNILTDSIYIENYKGHEYKYIIKLAEKGDIK